MPKRVLICGDRNWLDFKPIHQYVAKLPENSILIEGGAKGADILAREAGLMRGWELYVLRQNEHYLYKDRNWLWYHVENIIMMQGLFKHGGVILEFPANWEHPQERSGGPIRNSAQLALGNPQTVVAYHNRIQESKGTKDMLSKALRKGVESYLYSDTHGLRAIFLQDTRLRKEVKK